MGIICAILCLDGFCYAGVQLCFHSKNNKKEEKNRKEKKNQVSACPNRAVSPGACGAGNAAVAFKIST